MITEDYVSFETAKLLKEKGFEQECHTAYFNGTRVDYTMFGFCIGDNFIYAPTLQMAMKWLRENYWIFCVLRQYVEKETENISYNWNVEGKLGISVGNGGGFRTYEEACEAAIKYCLENLI